MVSTEETYPTLTPQEVAEFQRLDAERLKNPASDEITGELGHLAIAMVSGGTVDADKLPAAEYADTKRQQGIDAFETQFTLEAIDDSKRNTLRNLGSVAALDTLYGYDDALIAQTDAAEVQAALQRAAYQQQTA